VTDEARSVAERYCTAWANDDLDGILGCYSDGFILHYFGDNPFSGDHVGKDAALATLLAVGAKAPRQLIEIENIMAGERSAVVVARELINVDGDDVEIRRVLRYRIDGDQFAECWLYEESQALIDRAWS
jgi:hypothetical protein